jgi:O-antigen/teichoic acid export membrane protein
VFVNGIVQVPLATIQAAGRPDLTARIYLIEIPVYLPTLWWMTHRWGIEGAAIAWSLRGGLDLLIQCVVARRLLPAPAPEIRITIGDQRGTAVVASGFALFGFAAAAIAPTLSARTIVVVLVLVAFGALGWTRMLDPQERAYARRFVHRATARFRTA